MINELIQSIKEEPIEFVKNLTFLSVLTQVFYVLIWIFY